MSSEPLVLPGPNLRLRPVDVEDLGLARLQGGEILVEASLLDLALLVAVGIEVFPQLVEPAASHRRWEHAVHDCAAGGANGRARRLGDPAVTDVAILDLGNDRPSSGGVRLDDVGGPAHVSLHLVERPSQRVAVRHQRTLEGHDSAGDVRRVRRGSVHGGQWWPSLAGGSRTPSQS